MKFVIFGYYGYASIGDEAILRKIINDIKNNIISSHITVFSANPSYTREFFKINSVKNSIFHNFFTLIKEIIRSDCFILGGGGMLSDWQKSSPFLWLTLPIFSILFRKKLIIYGVGVNPFRTLYGKLLLKFVLKHSSLIIVRDIYSKLCLINFLDEKEKIHVTIDPAIGLNTPKDRFFKSYIKNKKISNKSLTEKPKIGICPSAFFHIPKLWSNSPNRYNRLKQDFSRLIQFLIDNYRANIFLIPISMKYDIIFCKEICKLLDENSKSSTFIIDSLKTPTNLRDILSNMDLIIGMRFHSIVLSINLAIPFVGITYGKKHTCLLKKINYLHNSIIISDGIHEKNKDMDFNKIKEIIARVWNDKDNIREFLKEKRNILINIEKSNISLLKKVMIGKKI